MRLTTLAIIVAALGLAAPSFALGASGARAPLLALQPAVSSPAPPEFAPSSTAATFQWVDGGLVSHAYYRGCFPEFWFDHFVTNYVGQYVATDLSAPKVNDVYYLHIYTGVAPTSSCAGGADLRTEVILPDHTTFAVSMANPVYCYYNGILITPGSPDDAVADCPRNPAARSNGAYGRNMGTRIVPNDKTFEIQFPVKSSQALRGMAGPGDSTKLVMPTQVTLAANDWTAPFQWINVLSNGTPTPYISYPTPSATSITANDARTAGYLYSYNQPGNAIIQLDTTPGGAWAYDTGPITIPTTGAAWEVWANEWGGPGGNLNPGTKYYWRLCFDENGPGVAPAQFCGATQNFTTRDTANPVVNLTSPAAGASAGRTVTLKANAVDAQVAKVEFLVDGNVVGSDTASPYSVPWNSKLKPDGPVSIQARATDASTNVGLSGLRTINVDNTKPNTTITAGPLRPAAGASATFRFKSSEPTGAKFQCKLDAGGWRSCASPKRYTGISLGSHTFRVRAIDRAGNVDPTPAAKTWRRR